MRGLTSSVDLQWVCPGVAPESYLLARPNWFSKPARGGIADIWALAADHSRFDKPVRNKMRIMIEPSFDPENPRREIALINGGLVFVPKLTAQPHFLRVDGREMAIEYHNLFLPGRLREGYIAQADRFAEATRDAPLQLADPAMVPKDADYCVQSHYVQNFFHFLTETMPYIGAVSAHGGKGRVFITDVAPFPGFVRDFIDTIFPDLTERIVLHSGVTTHENVLVPADLTNLAYVHGGVPQPELPSRLQLRSLDLNSVGGQTAIFNNSQCIWLRRLRRAGLEKIPDRLRGRGSRRLLISRKRAASRKLIEEDLLLKALAPLGFEEFVAEGMSAIEQIAAFNSAEIIIGPHGAGQANMIFCNPDCHVIELTQRQFMARARHFIRLADTARCTFESIICDEHGTRFKVVDNVGNDIILSADARDRLVSHVQDIIAGRFTPFARKYCTLAEAGAPA
ncbi:glycosyltransferase family 61 protein [Paracoccus pacificus]|uniref:Glycosyltransferase family 61 protein n=1 Tax=Paracoccus pacificus TaxID=1463598 RepID=A0ABW4RAP7_9RHOB